MVSAWISTYAPVAVLLYLLYRRLRRSNLSIAHIKGPEHGTWLYGNWIEYSDVQVGETDFKWQEMYGDVVRFRAPFGQDILLISDPKAIQYVYHTASYRFPKPSGRRAISHAIFGPGLSNVEGEDHKRARKVMLPGFGGPESKTYLPTFFNCAGRVTQKWQDLIASEDTQSAVVDIPSWISRATLDAIGEAAFDYQFGALDDSENPLAKIYTNLFFEMSGMKSKGALVATALVDDLPPSVAAFMLKHTPPPWMKKGIQTRELSSSIATSLIADKADGLLEGDGRRDVMSLLVKANKSANPKTQLSEPELVAQMNIIILAGHETTANTLSFALIELCKNPEIQTRLRDEIRSVGKPSDAFTSNDFDNMPYLTSIVKETLRFHPIVYNAMRLAEGDDVLPLSSPIQTETGETITEIPIPKGTKVVTSIAAYNRNKTIFGEDADVFNPNRWIREDSPESKISLGVYANLFTFVGGSRSCIGWRFALLELNAFLVELVGKFEFDFACSVDDIRREGCGVMTPTLESERIKGSQLPLRIRIASDDA